MDNGGLDKRDRDQEKSKLFVGGISSDASEDDIRSYFSKFGDVIDLSVKYDPVTGKPRGFCFITFGSEESIENVLKSGPHMLKNKSVDPKRAKSRPICKKVFVGGVCPTTSEQEIRDYFGKFGTVEAIELPYDKSKGKRREFCFILYEKEEAADLACKEAKQTIGGRECDVKKAQPQPVAQQQKRMGQRGQTSNQNYYSGHDGGGYDSNAAAKNKKRPGNEDLYYSNDYYANAYQCYYPYPQGYDQYYGQYGYGYGFGVYYGAYGYGDDLHVYGDAGNSASLNQIGDVGYNGNSQSSQSSHSHYNSGAGKSSRKSGSSSGYHPYRSASSH